MKLTSFTVIVKQSDPLPDIDWSLTTWEGSRREQLRRWAELPLESIVLALEEMEDLAREFASAGSSQQ